MRQYSVSAGLVPHAYRHKACRVAGHISCNSYRVRSCRRYWQFFFCAYSVAVFCCILPYSASHNILSYSACHILPYSAVHILPYSAVDTSRFERAEDGERVGVIGACWRCRRVLAGLNSSSGVIIVVIQAIRRKEALIYRLY